MKTLIIALLMIVGCGDGTDDDVAAAAEALQEAELCDDSDHKRHRHGDNSSDDSSS